jgi:Uma2 family endonuclease
MLPVPNSQLLPNGRRWPPIQGRWTHADWVRIPEGSHRYERVGGELFLSPPPNMSHQGVISHLMSKIYMTVSEKNLGEVFTGPVGVVLPGKTADLQPDIVFVSNKNLSIIKKDMMYGAPDIVIEVLSPSNWHLDRKIKFDAYCAARVPEYWIVDCEKRTIEQYVLHQKKYRLKKTFGIKDTLTAKQIKGFSVRLKDLFKR